jgi:hypothetical protein
MSLQIPLIFLIYFIISKICLYGLVQHQLKLSAFLSYYTQLLFDCAIIRRLTVG